MYREYCATHPFGWDRQNILNAILKQAVLAPHTKGKVPSYDDCLVKFSIAKQEGPDDLIAQFDAIIAQQSAGPSPR